ncbi:hypothetical protein C9374_004215 [Naegleria lovaniensis]|uniref:ADP-ribosylation factor-like protein 16 n=1 Tax=Naegleria lovaniensis TaxID=51637 RepID=A0AA88GQX9_NAELO|nr:uncharacterized protein C9374_004215 [Naegleria lovaniensis]KAG2383544.1 hypothetical protein C9374_004215 [Naegleria lovaniensis]
MKKQNSVGGGILGNSSNSASSSIDVLMLGLQGSGKSFLIKQMKNYLQNNDYLTFYDGLPTNGVNLDELIIGGKKKSKKIKLREVGGGIILTWHRYLDECKVIVFVIDSSCTMQLSSSCIELLNLLANHGEQKPFIVVLNKRDAPSVFSSEIFQHFIKWNNVKEHCKHVELLEVSALTGQNIHSLIEAMDSLI